jgi:hypothetical protein
MDPHIEAPYDEGPLALDACLGRINLLYEEKKSWRTECILMNVFDDVTAEPRTSTAVNIAQYNGTRAGRRGDKGKRIYFADFNENNKAYRESKVFPTFRAACKQAGFPMISTGYSNARCRVILSCNRFMLHKNDEEDETDHDGEEAIETMETRRSRNRPTGRPTKEDDRCSFQFPVYWDEEIKLFYIWEKNAGCLEHKGHPKVHPDEIKVNLKDLPPEETQVASQMFDVHANTSTTAALLAERTGLHLTSSQMLYMRRRRRAIRLAAEGFDNDASSPADRLLHQLESDSTVSYVILTAEWDTSLITVRRSNRPRPRIRLTLRRPGQEDEDLPIDPATLEDAADSAMDFATSVRDSLRIADSDGQILIAVVWTTDKSRLLLARYPEAVVVDVHMGTNSEARPLIVLVAKNAENKLFWATQGFLGNASGYMFRWFWERAHAILHGVTTISRNIASATDGEVNLYSPFQSLCGVGKPYCNAVWRLCSWHKIDRGMKSGVKASLPPTEGAKKFRRVIIRWLWSLTDNVETAEEANDSIRKLGQFLSHPLAVGALGRTYARAVLDWIVRSFLKPEYLEGLLFYHRLYRRDFDLRTSSLAESAGGALKKSAVGPKPNHPIDQSAAAQLQYQARLHAHHDFAAARALTLTHINPSWFPAYDEMTDHASRLLHKQFEQSSNYDVLRRDASTFYVKRKSEESLGEGSDSGPTDQQVDRATDRASDIATDCEYYIPRYERTRVVTLRAADDQPNQVFLHCSCGYYHRQGIVCRHQYAILTRGTNPLRQEPLIGDVIVRWWKSYGYFHLEDDALTRAFEEAILLEGCGAAIGHRDNLQQIDWLQDKPPTFFTSSLNCIKHRSGSYWQSSQVGEVDGNGRSRGREVQPRESMFGVGEHVHLSALAESSQISQEEVTNSGGTEDSNNEDFEFPTDDGDHEDDCIGPDALIDCPIPDLQQQDAESHLCKYVAEAAIANALGVSSIHQALPDCIDYGRVEEEFEGMVDAIAGRARAAASAALARVLEHKATSNIEVADVVRSAVAAAALQGVGEDSVRGSRAIVHAGLLRGSNAESHDVVQPTEDGDGSNDDCPNVDVSNGEGPSSSGKDSIDNGVGTIPGSDKSSNGYGSALNGVEVRSRSDGPIGNASNGNGSIQVSRDVTLEGVGVGAIPGSREELLRAGVEVRSRSDGSNGSIAVSHDVVQEGVGDGSYTAQARVCSMLQEHGSGDPVPVLQDIALPEGTNSPFRLMWGCMKSGISLPSPERLQAIQYEALLDPERHLMPLFQTVNTQCSDSLSYLLSKQVLEQLKDSISVYLSERSSLPASPGSSVIPAALHTPFVNPFAEPCQNAIQQVRSTVIRHKQQFRRLVPIFSEICKSCTERIVYYTFREVLSQLRTCLMTYNNSKLGNVRWGSERRQERRRGFGSLPSVDMSQKNKRQKPIGSPGKR